MARGARQFSKTGFRVIPGPAARNPELAAIFEPGDLALAAASVAESKQAGAVVVIDIRDLSPFCSYFVIATASNPRLMDTVMRETLIQMKQRFGITGTVEGADSEEWRLIDFGQVAIHLFSPDGRRFYQIEKLWHDAPRVEAGQVAAVTA